LAHELVVAVDDRRDAVDYGALLRGPQDLRRRVRRGALAIRVLSSFGNRCTGSYPWRKVLSIRPPRVGVAENKEL
ncbi:MAG: hypothetical protein II622_04840, partial [Thermoguttaceae bacterium]|nr:hypothetical protein [Thermoguttaceae bacterium]